MWLDHTEKPTRKVEVSSISVEKLKLPWVQAYPKQGHRGKCPVELTDVDCTPEEREQLQQLLFKHADVFIQDGDDFGYTET